MAKIAPKRAGKAHHAKKIADPGGPKSYGSVGSTSGIGTLEGRDYDEKLVELGLEKLSDRRTEADLTLVYKVLNGQCTVNKVLWADMAARDNNVTRAAMDNLSLKKPFARTDKRFIKTKKKLVV
jgi:hypothetical protein